MGDWEGVRLHVVTGKGGTGKTTVAASLALALASADRRVLLVEVEARQGIAPLFDQPPLPYEERRIAAGLGGGDVHALAVDPHKAMAEYLDLYYHLGRAGRALDRIGAVDFATTVAPGLRDVLLTGKTYEAVRRKGENGRYVYDAVVLDAPPTGRIVRFLNVNDEVAGLAHSGPVHRHAQSIVRLMHSAATAVHVVTLPEEMPVQETLDAIGELRATRLRVGAVVVNQVVRPRLPSAELSAARRGRLDADAVAEGLRAAGLRIAGQGAGSKGGAGAGTGPRPAARSGSGLDAYVAALLDEGRAHAEIVTRQKAQRRLLARAGLPVYDVPRLAEGVDVAALYDLAAVLAAQGAGPGRGTGAGTAAGAAGGAA